MTTTEGINFVIAGQNKASSALNSAAAAMNKLGKSTKGAATAMKGLAAIQIGSILASGMSRATQFVTGYVKGLVDAKDQLNDVANRTGVAVESLQSLGWAAQLSGVENFTGGMQKFTVAMGKAIESGKTEAFSELGLDMQNLIRMAPDEQFRAVSAAISKLPTEAERAAAAVQLFGKSGAELVPLFSSNLAEAEAQARSLGMVLSQQQVSALADMNDALDGVKGTFEGIIAQVASNLAPMVTSMAEEFMGFVSGFQGVAGATGGNALADAITSAFFDVADTLAGLFDWVLAGFGDFAGKLEYAVKVFQMVADIFTAVSEGLQMIFNGFETFGNLLMQGLGKLIEGIGSWVSTDLEEFGRNLAEASAEAARENAQQAEQNAMNAGRAIRDAVMGRDGSSSPAGTGPASQAVATARAAFDNLRNQTTDPADEERKRNAREQAARGMQRDAAQKKAAEEYKKIMKDGADAMKGIGELTKKRDDIIKEQSEKMLSKTPENSAVVDRFLSRGPYMEANERTAKATEELAELNKKMKEKQDAIAKAAEATAKNTANMFGMVM